MYQKSPPEQTPLTNFSNLSRLFSTDYDRGEWLIQLRQIFPNIEIFTAPQVIPDEDSEKFIWLGRVQTSDQKILGIYEVIVGPSTKLARNRVKLRQMVSKQISKFHLHGALAVYVDQTHEQWRFSFLAKDFKLQESGEIDKYETDAKRYTYLFGSDARTRTAVSRFASLPKNPALEQLRDAFAVGALNKEFYIKLNKWYQNAKKVVVFPIDESHEEIEEYVAVSLIRLITRLLFVWFLKEKRLINPNLFKFGEVISIIHWEKPSSYYKAILQNLFFATLNRKIHKRKFCDLNSSSGLSTNEYRYRDLFRNSDCEKIIGLFSKTPFLNGGLFECLDSKKSSAQVHTVERRAADQFECSVVRVDGFTERKDNPLCIPNLLFFTNDESNPGLIELFDQYQFTVEESSSFDVEVALDPELMGVIFENLLADYNDPRTQTTAQRSIGSFYTPREIVNYMVDESLKAYLAAEVPPQDDDLDFYFERLDYLFLASSSTDSLEASDGKTLIYDEEIPKLIDAISRVRILDPAAGSGAFPMGILQRLVSLLGILDPDNKLWRKRQLESLPDLQTIENDLKIVKSISDEGIKSRAEAELNRRKEEIVATFSDQYDNYARKLYLIEKCIFGVDIAPIAIQIAKLRLFISLVIEQDVKLEVDNFGIRTLPNLETRFVVADSLLGLNRSHLTQSTFSNQQIQLEIRNLEIKEQENILESVRSRYFNAVTEKQKKRFRKKDEAIRKKIARLLVDDGWENDDARKIVEWDPYDPYRYVNWFDPKWMFGNSKGFDIVIGNPPYIPLQDNEGKLRRQYKNAGFKTLDGEGDIYQLFYEKGCRLLRPSQGILAYITSNSWLKAISGRKSRKWLSSNHSLIKLIEVGESVFENAIVDVNILILRHGESDCVCEAVDLDKLQNARYFPPKKKDWTNLHIAGNGPWCVLSKQEQHIKSKIEEIGTPLKLWDDISIYRGITTGLNDAFVIDNKTKEALVEQDPRSAEIIKPVLRGRDIQRYKAQWAERWLIATFPTLRTNIKNYPAVEQKLLSFGKDRLEQEGKTLAHGGRSRKKTPHKWFELQDTCAYHAHFAKAKLVWIQLVNDGRFAYDSSGKLCNDSTCILTGSSLKYLCGILNSQLIRWYLQQIAPTSGTGTSQWKKAYVEKIPIPRISPVQQRLITKSIEAILLAKDQDVCTDTAQIEHEIDKKVFELYQISESEFNALEKR